MLKKIKMLESIASSEGWAYGCGQIVEIDAVLAALWVKGGIAEYTEIETAIITPPEKAILKKAGIKK